ncbi:hypothetical protein ES703_52732 [subsurface metagenome]
MQAEVSIIPSIAILITPVLSQSIPAMAPSTMGVESLRLRSRSPTISKSEPTAAQRIIAETVLNAVVKNERLTYLLNFFIKGIIDPIRPMHPSIRIDLPVNMESFPSVPNPMSETACSFGKLKENLIMRRFSSSVSPLKIIIL